MKIAIVGSGVSGLAAAHRLRGQAQISLFEADAHFGGHAHTVDVTLPKAQGGYLTHGVDTGFLVYNERTYPQLIALLAELDVATVPTDMSFSVQVPGPHGDSGTGSGSAKLEWSGSDLRGLFAQPGNALRPQFWGMLADVLRFNRLCTALAKGLVQPQAAQTAQTAQTASARPVETSPQPQLSAELAEPLQSFLDRHRFGAAFRDWYFLPMLGCIWSCPTDQMLQFPVATMIAFCHNHGLLQITRRPQWHTVRGGSRHYVEKIIAGLPDARLRTPVRRIDRDSAGVTLHTERSSERFDHVVLAVHSDQALALLQRPSVSEVQVLGAIRYQPNRAVLHTDTSVLPQQRSAWAAWNYERAASAQQESQRVCLHYLLSRLQPLPFEQTLIETLNPVRPIAPAHVLAEFDYSHPVFDLAAIAAQRRVPELQGQQRTWYCGAWTGYGFHEDGLGSGLAVAQALQTQVQQQAQWTQQAAA